MAQKAVLYCVKGKHIVDGAELFTQRGVATGILVDRDGLVTKPNYDRMRGLDKGEHYLDSLQSLRPRCPLHNISITKHEPPGEEKTPDIFVNEEGNPDFDAALELLEHYQAGAMCKAVATLRKFRSAADICFGCLRESLECSKDPCPSVVADRGETA